MKNTGLFKKIIGHQLREMRRNTHKLLHRYSAECVHDLRVAALRTDFSLKFFLTRSNTDKIKKIRDRLRMTRGIMGDARNLDILLSRARQNSEKAHLTPSQAKGVLSLIQARRNESHNTLIKTLKSTTYGRVFRDLKDIRDHRRLPSLKGIIKGPFRKTIVDLMGYRKESVNSHNLHKIRIAFKKLRYACEFLEGVDRPRMQKVLKFIRKFQDLLGERQDSIAAVQILSGFNQEGMGNIIKMEKDIIKECGKKFEEIWNKSFHKHPVINKLYHWDKYYS